MQIVPDLGNVTTDLSGHSRAANVDPPPIGSLELADQAAKNLIGQLRSDGRFGSDRPSSTWLYSGGIRGINSEDVVKGLLLTLASVKSDYIPKFKGHYTHTYKTHCTD